ncbi:hypothetical protein ACFWP5_29400 [Streptomyces sp. NPDC058469]|uniref:hypothetical protein n=1 Tax=Streptomyces sp. NPDC058469 TaxID=3346514 RepID=UPI00365DF93F
MPTVADDSVAGAVVVVLVEVPCPADAVDVPVLEGGGDMSVVVGSEDGVAELPVGVEVGVVGATVVCVGVGLAVPLGGVSGVRVGVAVGSVGLTAGRGSGACGLLSTPS